MRVLVYLVVINNVCLDLDVIVSILELVLQQGGIMNVWLAKEPMWDPGCRDAWKGMKGSNGFLSRSLRRVKQLLMGFRDARLGARGSGWSVVSPWVIVAARLQWIKQIDSLFTYLSYYWPNPS